MDDITITLSEHEITSIVIIINLFEQYSSDNKSRPRKSNAEIMNAFESLRKDGTKIKKTIFAALNKAAKHI